MRDLRALRLIVAVLPSLSLRFAVPTLRAFRGAAFSGSAGRAMRSVAAAVERIRVEESEVGVAIVLIGAPSANAVVAHRNLATGIAHRLVQAERGGGFERAQVVQVHLQAEKGTVQGQCEIAR